VLREGGAEAALRVAAGPTGMREELTAVGVDAAAVRPFSARISFSFAEDEDAEEFAFTKRCSCGS
jgi:hypothetical protein